MKKVILALAGLLLLSTGVRAQVIASFADSSLGGMVKNAGGTDSIYVAPDPAGVYAHVLGWHMTLTGTNNAQIQTDNISVNGAQLITYWIYIPSSENIPDTTVIGLWTMDHTNWSWKETDFKASDVPKNQWYPLSQPLTQIALQNPTSFNPVSNQIRVGLQIQGATWSGKFYLAQVALVGARPTLITDPMTVQWSNAHTTSITQVDTLVGGVAGAWADSLTGGTDGSGGAAFGDQPTGAGLPAQIEHYLVTWVYVDSTFPDTASIQTWAQSDPSWNWPSPTGPVTYKGSSIPKDVWYPLYFDLAQASIVDTASGSYFNTLKSSNNLRKFGIQIFGTNWVGRVFMANISMLHDTVKNIAPPPVWVAANFENQTGNMLQGFRVPSYASGKLTNIPDYNTSNGTYVLQGAADLSKAPHMFAAVRDTVPMKDNLDSIATGVSFQVYLPAGMPPHGKVLFYVSGGTGDSLSVVDSIGSNNMRPGQWNTMSILKLDSLAGVGEFDPTIPAQVGVVIWYPAPYDTTSWKGDFLFDNLTVYGVSFPEQLVDGVKGSGVVKSFRLYNNYPNPFNPSTVVQYDIPKTSKVVIQVYDVLGREVTTLVNAKQAAGSYKVNLNMSKYASGVYFVRMNAGSYVKTQQMMLLK